MSSTTFKSAALLCAILILISCCYVKAQFYPYPEEECHQECEVVHCDYYGIYCDYECHEICYPYKLRSSSTPTSDVPPTKKILKMRLNTPPCQAVNRKFHFTPLKGIAVYQNCNVAAGRIPGGVSPGGLPGNTLRDSHVKS